MSHQWQKVGWRVWLWDGNWNDEEYLNLIYDAGIAESLYIDLKILTLCINYLYK